jgi:hypothetical protein
MQNHENDVVLASMTHAGSIIGSLRSVAALQKVRIPSYLEGESQNKKHIS